MMLRLRRVGSLALLLALLGGGLGLPLFDAVVFHGRPGAAAAERTLAEAGSRPTHQQLCILDHAATLSPSLAAAQPIRLQGTPDVSRPCPRAQLTARPLTFRPDLSRAPPAVA
ncbi:MAG: hypothetical protein U0104_06380 [Gemmatimonadales bacterium]